MHPLVTVESDTRGFELWARKVMERQMPFAVAKALTLTARDSARYVRRKLRDTFTIRNQRVAKGIRSTAARKADWPSPYAIIGTIDRFMADHALGRVRKPLRSRRIAVPTKFAADKRTRSGKLRVSVRPRTLFAKRGAFVRDQVVLAPRTRRKGARLLPYFTLHRRVRIPRRWPIVSQVWLAASRAYGDHFPRELRRAITTPRPKRPKA